MKALKWIDEYLEESVMVVLLILLSCVMMFQVIMRYFFNAALPWPEEFSRYCFIVSVFMSVGYCVRKKKMLRIDVVLGMLPKPAAFAVDMLSKIANLVFYAIIFNASLGVVSTAKTIGQVSPAMEIPMWILYIIVPVGFALGIVRAMQEIFLVIKEKVTESKGQKEESAI